MTGFCKRKQLVGDVPVDLEVLLSKQACCVCERKYVGVGGSSEWFHRDRDPFQAVVLSQTMSFSV